MMKIWNPIEAYRKASQRSQEAQTRHEANTKICIGDYTDSKGATYTALIIDGIMYIAWLLHEVKIAVPEENEVVSQNEATQSHETTSNEETPSNETKTQQEARK